MIWLILLGIIPERIKKGCPQENGRHERMHRTLKSDALDLLLETSKNSRRHLIFTGMTITMSGRMNPWTTKRLVIIM